MVRGLPGELWLRIQHQFAERGELDREGESASEAHTKVLEGVGEHVFVQATNARGRKPRFPARKLAVPLAHANRVAGAPCAPAPAVAIRPRALRDALTPVPAAVRAGPRDGPPAPSRFPLDGDLVPPAGAHLAPQPGAPAACLRHER